MYDDSSTSYSQLVTTAQKDESKQTHRGIQDARVKAAQAKKGEVIHGLQYQIVQL